MWKTFEFDDNLYMSRVKVNPSNNVVLIHMTDLKSVWFEEISSEAVLERFQECNPNFEITQDEAVKQICDLLENIGTKQSEVLSVKSEENRCLVTLKSPLSEFTFKYDVNMMLADSSCFFKEITVPFIHTIKYLEEQQQKLIDLIEKKDRELEEYRVEKGTITRSDLQTEKFKKDDLECSHEKLMMNVFKDSNFWNTFVEQNGRPEIGTLLVVKDHWNCVNKKRKIYSSKTVTKKPKGISYNTNTK